MVWFYPVGLLLGAAASLTGLGLGLLIDGSSLPVLGALVSGLVWLMTLAWLTFGMHWDGVADLADASLASPGRFREILADSRLGTFGALALFMGLCSQWLLASIHFARLWASWPCNCWMPLGCLCLAPAWARLQPIWLAWLCKPYPASRLGKLFCANNGGGARLSACLYALATLALLWGLAGPGALLMLACGQFWLYLWLVRGARKHGGVSGDFFGAAIETGQAIFLLAALC